MDVRNIWAIVIALVAVWIVVMASVIGLVILLYRKSANKLDKAGEVTSLECLECGNEIEIPSSYFVNKPFTPRRSLSVKINGTGGTKAMDRYIYCENCGRKRWCRQDLKKGTRNGI